MALDGAPSWDQRVITGGLRSDLRSVDDGQPQIVGHAISRVLLLVWMVTVLFLTLRPSWSAGAPPSLCLFCGTRATADIILNIGLFAPFGFLVASQGARPLTTCIAAFVLSLSVETAQLVVPSRHPTAGDIFWNTLGAGAGGLGYIILRARLRSTSGFLIRASAVSLSITLGIALWVGGWLFEPIQTKDRYFGQWKADLAWMPQFQGEVLDAKLNGAVIPLGAAFRTEQHPARQLSRDWEITAELVAGPQTSSVAPIASIYDERHREIILLGADGADLVLREGLRARRLRFDQPDLRFVDAFAGTVPGDTLTVAAERNGDARCLVISERRKCGLGFTPGRTWGLLLYVERLSEAARRALDVGWVFVVLFPIGILSTSAAAASGAGLIVATAVALTAWTTPMMAPPLAEVLGAVAGVVLGMSTVHYLRRAD